MVLKTISLHSRRMLIFALILAFLVSSWPIQVGQAGTTIRVTSFIDDVRNDGFCTLREAIISANKDSASGRLAGECPPGRGADTILIPAGTYTLTRTDSGREDAATTGDLDTTADVIIKGEGAVTIATLNPSDRIFHILSGNVTLSGLTIRGGKVTGDGGAIYNNGNLIFENSTLTGNVASARGGGIFNTSNATLTVINSTLSGNTASRSGGGVHNEGSASFTNATFSGNQASGVGGTGGNLAAAAGALTLKNTLLANPGPGANCSSGVFTSAGYNLSTDTSCSAMLTQVGDINGVADAGLEPLGDNGGPTLTHALVSGSPAIDAIPFVDPTSCPATDQRGVTRPQGARCDIGAYEKELQTQPGPIFTVTNAADSPDGMCTFSDCSLREAINAANARPNDATPDEIHFNIPGEGPHLLQPLSALPVISDPVVIDGASQPAGGIILDGSQAGAAVDGFSINSGGSTVRSLAIQGFSGNGIILSTNGNNTILDNTINANGANGVQVSFGTGNSMLRNRIFNNGQPGIDLGGDGATPNDAGDADSGANNLQNFPVLMRAIPGSGQLNIQGHLNSTPGANFNLEFFANPTCDASNNGQGETFLDSLSVATDADGNARFTKTLSYNAAAGQFITATATDPANNTSEFSQCVPASPGNDSWVKALPLGSVDSVDQFIDKQGQSRWFKIDVQPGSKVIVTLTNLPANYDLALYKDIGAAFKELVTSKDLLRLGAEFAPDNFSPDNFSADVFSPDNFSPDNFSPDNFSPDNFSPDNFSPDNFSSDIFSPDNFSPDNFSPDNFSPDNFSPDNFSPDNFSPEAFSSAQTRSLIAVSAFNGVASEGINANTWLNDGNFYIRVRGRNGVFNLQQPFHLTVTQLQGACGAVTANLGASNTQVSANGYKTIVLVDPARMQNRMQMSDQEKADLLAKLSAFVNPTTHPEVAGVVVDVGADSRVAAANTQADNHVTCPYTKNLVAESIKEIVDRYWEVNPLEYVVIIGNDDIIPFFRYPDQALLANEKNYVPPVRDSTASQASLRLGYVLSQDRYGAKFDISQKNSTFPIPELGVGRLVETPAEVMGMLDAYENTNQGVVTTPTSSLVTGYDFLEDAARAVSVELGQGTGNPVDELIARNDLSPLDDSVPVSENGIWSAADLSSKLLGSRHDLIFLAGHFSAGSALAADYRTRLLASEVANSSVDLVNAIIFSAGCHAGYNIVNPHGLPNITLEPDWAQAFARKQATLIAGTGYQYGDTDFIEYSERLYLEFTRQLRYGNDPVPVGKALAAAKLAYLAGTWQVRGIHEKALLEATLFGLPMLSVDYNDAGRLPLPGNNSIVSGTNAYSEDPGNTLGLRYADVNLPLNPQMHSVNLVNLADKSTVVATYFSGTNGVVSNPAEPVLPLEIRNVSVSGMVLRGVGFKSGTYEDLENILPLIGSATTEVRGAHAPFLSNIFYPISLWEENYFDALAALGNGATRLIVTPAHFKSSAPGDSKGTLRWYKDMAFRLFYSTNCESPQGCQHPNPMLSAAPSITHISASAAGGEVTFQVRLAGNPAAGIQEAWVTYTSATSSGPFAKIWQSLFLERDPGDSTLWQGTLPLQGTLPDDLRFIVQAVNGGGLVSLSTNQGAYYKPGVQAEPFRPTTLSLTADAASGAYGTKASFTATLTSEGAPLPDQAILFGIGSQRQVAVTGSNGQATVSLPLLGLPGQNEVRASYAGTVEFLPSTDTKTFTITKQNTCITLQPQTATGVSTDDSLMVATLTEGACPAGENARRLVEKSVFFIIQGPQGSASVHAITNLIGQASLGNLSLPAGEYTVTARFSGEITLDNGETLNLEDERYNPSAASGSLTIHNPPICTAAKPSIEFIWPPNNNTFVPVTVLDVTDPEGDPVTITIDSIFQDEPVVPGNFFPDGRGIGTSTAEVRAERDGTGNGRVYHIFFTASDGRGGTCQGKVRSGVSENQGQGLDPFDEGPLYDSTATN